MKNQARLIIDGTDNNSDLLYATHFHTPDPFIYFEWKGKKYIVASDLELSRTKKEATVDKVLPLTQYRDPQKRGLAEVVHRVFQELRIKQVLVPANMGVALFMSLKKKGYALSIKEGAFYDERITKSSLEKQHIIASLRATEAAITEAKKVLAKSRIKKNLIYYGGTLVTSEFLRGVIDGHLFKNGYNPKDTIVAGSTQGADPHCTGNGPLKAHYPIVMDVFPRSMKTGYFGDITRTVVKGKASEAHLKMYDAVKAAQESAFKLIRADFDGKKVHEAVCRTFIEHGFKTEVKNGQPQGFIHGVGHGLGLDIHEAPRINEFSYKLPLHTVVTVEPGLYYPSLGGIRIEDVVFVTKTGIEMMTKIPRTFVIP